MSKSPNVALAAGAATFFTSRLAGVSVAADTATVQLDMARALACRHAQAA